MQISQPPLNSPEHRESKWGLGNLPALFPAPEEAREEAQPPAAGRRHAFQHKQGTLIFAMCWCREGLPAPVTVNQAEM